MPGGLRSGGHEPLSRLRDTDCNGQGPAGGDQRVRGCEAFHQVGRQGPAEGHVEDGHLDLCGPTAERRSSMRSVFRRRCSTSFSSARRRRSKAASPISPRRHTASLDADAFGASPVLRTSLEVGGEMPIGCAAKRTVGRRRPLPPQHAVRGNAQDRYNAFDGAQPARRSSTIRGLFRVKLAEEDDERLRLAEVEPAAEIVKRFATARCRSARSPARRTPRSPSP